VGHESERDLIAHDVRHSVQPGCSRVGNFRCASGRSVSGDSRKFPIIPVAVRIRVPAGPLTRGEKIASDDTEILEVLTDQQFVYTLSKCAPHKFELKAWEP